MAKGKGTGGGAAATGSALVKAQFVLRREQVVALRRAALEKQASGEPGRADASAVLRDVLDRWMKKQG